MEINPDVQMPGYVFNRLKGNYRDKSIIVDPEQPGAIAPSCVAHYAKDLGTRLVKDKQSEHGLRPFSIREYGRLQGFPDDFKFENKLSSYRLIGNAVPVDMGRWVGEQAMKYFN
jgi:DNA (cytosine-5)-methyltransferase 1